MVFVVCVVESSTLAQTKEFNFLSLFVVFCFFRFEILTMDVSIAVYGKNDFAMAPDILVSVLFI